jgi:hypothetical protein
MGLIQSSCFENYIKTLPSNIQKEFDVIPYDNVDFKSMFKREPLAGEDVKGMLKAQFVINLVIAMSPTPTGLSYNECKLLFQTSKLMNENNPMYNFPIGMAIQNICAANPNCSQYWDSMKQ